MNLKIAKISLFSGMDKELSYLVPKELEPKISKGSMVRVPLRSSTATGVVMEICDNPPQREEKFSLKEYTPWSSPNQCLRKTLLSYHFGCANIMDAGFRLFLKALFPQ